MAIVLSLFLSLSPREMTKERGVVPRIDVCAPALQESPSFSLPSSPTPSGGSYTNFQECLPPHPSTTLESPFPSSPFSFSTSRAGSSSFHSNLEAGLCILYSVCDRSRLVMYAGPAVHVDIYVSIYVAVCGCWGCV